MSPRAKELAEKFNTFNNEAIGVVENCSVEDWRKICPSETWTIGVVARHLGAGHYSALDFAKMIVAGEKMPDLTMDGIDEMNAQHAKEHAACTKNEVLDILRTNGAAMVDYISGLDDADLDRTTDFPAAGGKISAQQFIEYIVLQSGGEHLTSLRTTIGG
jgi:hypothetical protein